MTNTTSNSDLLKNDTELLLAGVMNKFITAATRAYDKSLNEEPRRPDDKSKNKLDATVITERNDEKEVVSKKIAYTKADGKIGVVSFTKNELNEKPEYYEDNKKRFGYVKPELQVEKKKNWEEKHGKKDIGLDKLYVKKLVQDYVKFFRAKIEEGDFKSTPFDKFASDFADHIRLQKKSEIPGEKPDYVTNKTGRLEVALGYIENCMSNAKTEITRDSQPNPNDDPAIDDRNGLRGDIKSRLMNGEEIDGKKLSTLILDTLEQSLAKHLAANKSVLKK